MKTRTILTATAVLLSSTSLAWAPPVFFAIGSGLTSLAIAVPGGTALLGALFPAGASAAAIGSAAVQGVLGLVSIGMQFIRPKTQTRSTKQTSQGAEGPGRHAFGLVEIDAQIIYGNTSGYYLSRWLAHAFGPLDRVLAYYYDGRELTVEPDGQVTSPPWSIYSSGEGAAISYMNVQTKVGDGTETAWPSLLTDFPSSITSDHRARGITASLLRIQSPGTQSDIFGRLLQGGIKPLKIKARMGKFYDPRDTVTRWSMNGVLHVFHHMRQLGGLTDAMFDFDLIGDAADAAEDLIDDTAVSGESNPVKCQLSGGWEGPLTTDIILDMMESGGIEEFQTDAGKTALRLIEDWPEPEIHFTEHDIIDNYPQAGPESGRRPNICRISYFSPERRYDKHDLDMTGVAWARIEDEITAYGDQELAIELPFCCNHVQAAYIARRLFYMARADFGLLITKFSGVAAWGKRTGLIDIPDVGTDGAAQTVRVRFDNVRPNDADGTVEIPYRIIPDILATAFDPLTDAPAPPPILLPMPIETDLTTPDQPIAACIVEYPDETREIRVHATTPAGATNVEAVFRLYDGEDPLQSQRMTEVEASGTFDTAYRQIKYNIFTNPATWGAGWSFTAPHWTASPPYLVATTGTQSAANQTHTFASGMSYDYIVTVSNRTAGSVRPRFGGGGAVEGTDISTNGTFTQTLVAGAASTTANFRKDATFDGKLSAPFLYHTGNFPVVELGVKVDFRKRIFDADGNASQWSDALVEDTIAIDNTAPTAPTVTVETFTGPGPAFDTLLRYKITPTSLTAVRATVEFTDDNGSTWTPGFATHAHIGLGLQSFDTEEQVAGGKGFRVTLYSSNGTAGATASAIYT